MLTHPVISSLLNHKWFHFGLLMYLLNLLVYIIFLVFLTSFALVVLTPQSNTCMFTVFFVVLLVPLSTEFAGVLLLYMAQPGIAN